MGERFRGGSGEPAAPDRPSIPPRFDREAEKEHRKEIRRLLDRALSETLRPLGFTKIGNSLWGRRAGNAWQLVYLQRSQFGHEYFIEAAVCRDEDVPKGKKPDVVYGRYSQRNRIEHVVGEIEHARSGQTEAPDSDRVRSVRTMLDFEAPGASAQRPNEYFLPSVDLDEAKRKIRDMQEVVLEFVPAWFEKHPPT